jgi:hypothetical protein
MLNFPNVLGLSLLFFNLATLIVIINANDNAADPVNRVVSNKASTLDVLYMVPDDLDEVFNLNEKETFGNGYYRGWLLPSGQPLTLNLYLYYDGLDQRRLNLFFNPANIIDFNSLANSSNTINNTIG